jgi:hypothetical protein
MAKNVGSPTKEKKGKAKTGIERTKVPLMPGIKNALAEKPYGFIFTTPASDRVYVISKGTWGKKSSDKIVKGFPSGTPYDEIKRYSERTKVKHGGEKINQTQGKKEKSKAEHGYATKAKPDKIKYVEQRYGKKKD